MHFLKYLNKRSHGTDRQSSRFPPKSMFGNQRKICSKFQGCILNLIEHFSFFPLTCKQKLHRRYSTGSSISTSLKLMIKTPEQHHWHRSCAFIVEFDQILYIGFHKYFAYYINSCVYYF